MDLLVNQCVSFLLREIVRQEIERERFFLPESSGRGVQDCTARMVDVCLNAGKARPLTRQSERPGVRVLLVLGIVVETVSPIE